MTEQPQHPCPHCGNVYPTQSQLASHRAANHWKLEQPNKRGKPGAKRQ